MRLQPAIGRDGAGCAVPARTVGALRTCTTGGDQSMSTTSTSSGTRATDDADVASTAKSIANDVADRAVAAAQHLPDAAAQTSVQIERANRIIQGESDEVLAVGTSLSIGLAMGLLLGGANRLL